MPAKLIQEKFVSALPGTLVANTLYYVRVGTGFDIYLTNNSGTIVAYPVNANPVPAETSTGTEIFFDKPQRHYGQSSPLSGNLTMNTTGAINGATVIIRYNAATMGSVPGSWIRLKNDFVASTDVVIVAVRFSSSIVYYTISKAV